MEKNILLTFIVVFFYTATSYAQEKTDSIASQLQGEDTKFTFKQLILPASLITAGALGLGNSYVKSINEDVKKKVAGFRSDYIKTDDYIQYLPVVSVYGLSIAGVKPEHDYIDRTLIVAVSYLSMGIMVNGLKYTIYSPRPNFHSNNSFPSGHTATAFMGAELVRQEYWDASPWYGMAAYSIAAGVGLMRVYNESHWATDIFAGAGVGILSARIGYWLLPFSKRLTGRGKTATSQLVIAPYYTRQQGGVGLLYQF
jgi:membrane-associated phospholipid phosphatase